MSAEAKDMARRLVEASAWRMRLDENDADAETAFSIWRADPKNAAAWERLAEPWNLIGEHANDPRMVAYRQAALNDARTASAALHRQATHWPWRRLAVAAMVLFAAAAVGYWRWIAPTDYSTAFGERRIITLSDGSKVSLDADSELTVRYTSAARELHLLKGQARFDVAHDVERPFSVLAREQKVIATGTAFNVDMTQPQVLVTLIEGHVVVVDESNSAATSRTLSIPPLRHRSVDLKAGQQLAALPNKPPEIEPADIQSAVAWTAGQLVFDDAPLSDVIARVNHYTTTPIVIGSKRVGAMRISGSFNAGDARGFLDIVTRYLPLREDVDGGGNVILREKDGSRPH